MHPSPLFLNRLRSSLSQDLLETIFLMNIKNNVLANMKKTQVIILLTTKKSNLFKKNCWLKVEIMKMYLSDFAVKIY